MALRGLTLGLCTVGILAGAPLQGNIVVNSSLDDIVTDELD